MDKNRKNGVLLLGLLALFWFAQRSNSSPPQPTPSSTSYVGDSYSSAQSDSPCNRCF